MTRQALRIGPNCLPSPSVGIDGMFIAKHILGILYIIAYIRYLQYLSLVPTVGLGCYAGWIFCTYVPYASDGSLDSPDQYEHFDTSLAPSNRMVEALEGVQVLAI